MEKKLTWAILSKAFGFSRQALSGNAAIKVAYDDAKTTLRGAASEIDALESIAKENEQLKNELAKEKELIHQYEQKYLRWQFNAAAKGISVQALNTPIPPSIKESLRERDKEV